MPPKHLPAMGSFGSYLSYYRHSFGMAPYDAEREAALEDERCSGFLERTQSLFDDFDRRKLLLTMEPPEAYEYARHVICGQLSPHGASTHTHLRLSPCLTHCYSLCLHAHLHTCHLAQHHTRCVWLL